MATDYEERLSICIDGDETTEFYTKDGEHIATGYLRVVIGGRGPYVEFKKKNMHKKCLHVPEDKKWKFMDKYADRIFYYEFRSKESNVKVYYQKNTVDYADYLINHFYISPFELYDSNGNVLIEKIRG